MSARKRVAFTTDEKVALRKQHAELPSLSQKELCKWFEESFSKPIRQATVSEVLSKQYNHLDQQITPLQAASKKQCLQAYPTVEHALSQWFFAYEATPNLAITSQQEPSFSDGWLSNFKRRYSIKNFKRHSEAASIDNASIAAKLARIQARVAQYAPTDQYNCDETGLF
ncbi:hypothetical protein MBLNU13_g00229t1 [Cladosporium sp. NU13]